MYRKGERRARILQVLHSSDEPATVASIEQSTGFCSSTVKSCLYRLVGERRVAKLRFEKVGIDPQDYRLFDKGRTPKYFFVIEPSDNAMLKYYQDAGVI
jgi:hypothetical protein